MADGPFSVTPLAGQDRTAFDCGDEALNTYLRLQAGQDMKRRVAACFLALDKATGSTAGFYTLSACHVRLQDIDPDWQRKLPRYPVVPTARLGRLAVDRRYQGRKLGAALLANATARAMRSDVAAHMLLVEAKDDTAAAFYRHHGLRPDPRDPLVLYAPLMTLARALGLD